MSNEVLVERHGDHILVLTLNRPEARNAINEATANAIAAVVENAEQDDSIRAVILTSCLSNIFCAGGDLKEISAGRSKYLATSKGGFAGFVRYPRKKPWIAAVAGKALGGGLECALACDMIVAGEEAVFGLPEVLRGVFAGAGGIFRLPRAVPRAIALHMVTTGLPIDAQRAYAVGLINKVVPTAAVLSEAVLIAEAICQAAPRAVQESLAVARVASETTELELWQLTGGVSERLVKTEDFKEGPRAFIEKRQPVWTGR